MTYIIFVFYFRPLFHKLLLNMYCAKLLQMNVPVQMSEFHKYVPIFDAVISCGNTASVSTRPHTRLVCLVL